MCSLFDFFLIAVLIATSLHPASAYHGIVELGVLNANHAILGLSSMSPIARLDYRCQRRLDRGLPQPGRTEGFCKDRYMSNISYWLLALIWYIGRLYYILKRLSVGLVLSFLINAEYAFLAMSSITLTTRLAYRSHPRTCHYSRANHAFLGPSSKSLINRSTNTYLGRLYYHQRRLTIVRCPCLLFYQEPTW